MKKITKPIYAIAGLFLLTATLFSCKDEPMSQYTYTANVPVYLSFEDLRSAAKTEEPRNMQEPGKIFYQGNYIFVSEYLKGVHVIDNSNPSSPHEITFINLPGNIDIAINGNTLYADSYVDLVAFDITDKNKIHEISRSTFTFEQTLPKYDERYPIADYDPSKGVVTGWKVETKTGNGNGYYGPMIGWKTASGETPAMQGKAGSMSRFALKNDFLYALDRWELKIFNISNPSVLQENQSVYGMGAAETIFPDGNKLYIGTANGMLIYDNSNEGSPYFEGRFNHNPGCDPVIVSGSKAYVTIRSGGLCGNAKDELHVLSITDPTNPVLEKSYTMVSPRGMAIENNTLYVCDGSAGLKIYNAQNPLALSATANITGYNANDIILYENNMMVIGPAGLEQFDRSNPANPVHLSTIPVYSSSAK